MTPQMLEQAGITLFGDSWKARVADLLERHPKAIQRYMARRIPIPKEHRLILVKALKEKRRQVDIALNLLLHAADDGSISLEYFDA